MVEDKVGSLETIPGCRAGHSAADVRCCRITGVRRPAEQGSTHATDGWFRWGSCWPVAGLWRRKAEALSPPELSASSPRRYRSKRVAPDAVEPAVMTTAEPVEVVFDSVVLGIALVGRVR